MSSPRQKKKGDDREDKAHWVGGTVIREVCDRLVFRRRSFIPLTRPLMRRRTRLECLNAISHHHLDI